MCDGRVFPQIELRTVAASLPLTVTLAAVVSVANQVLPDADSSHLLKEKTLRPSVCSTTVRRSPQPRQHAPLVQHQFLMRFRSSVCDAREVFLSIEDHIVLQVTEETKTPPQHPLRSLCHHQLPPSEAHQLTPPSVSVGSIGAQHGHEGIQSSHEHFQRQGRKQSNKTCQQTLS